MLGIIKRKIHKLLDIYNLNRYKILKDDGRKSSIYRGVIKFIYPIINTSLKI